MYASKSKRPTHLPILHPLRMFQVSKNNARFSDLTSGFWSIYQWNYPKKHSNSIWEMLLLLLKVSNDFDNTLYLISIRKTVVSMTWFVFGTSFLVKLPMKLSENHSNCRHVILMVWIINGNFCHRKLFPIESTIKLPVNYLIYNLIWFDLLIQYFYWKEYIFHIIF